MMSTCCLFTNSLCHSSSVHRLGSLGEARQLVGLCGSRGERISHALQCTVSHTDGCSDRSTLQIQMGNPVESVSRPRVTLCQRLTPGWTEADSRRADRQGGAKETQGLAFFILILRERAMLAHGYPGLWSQCN